MIPQRGMIMRSTFLALALLALLALLASATWAQIPPIDLFTADMAGPAHIWVSPSGYGPALTDAYVPGISATFDATIIVTLTDWNGDPIVGWPHEDVWLDELSPSAFVFCPAGTCADTDSDANGQMRFTSSLMAGGQIMPDDDTYVFVNGETLSSLSVPLSVNSPDINGDLTVNLSDVVFFCQGLTGTYDWRLDFNFDTVINLSDVVVMAQTLGQTCP